MFRYKLSIQIWLAYSWFDHSTKFHFILLINVTEEIFLYESHFCQIKINLDLESWTTEAKNQNPSRKRILVG